MRAASLIERWDGSAWQISASPTLPSGPLAGALNGVVALSATNAWAVGSFTASDHTIRTLIIHKLPQAGDQTAVLLEVVNVALALLRPRSRRSL